MKKIELWDDIVAYPIPHVDKYEVVFYCDYPWKKHREVKKVVVDGIEWEFHKKERNYLVKLYLDLK